MLLNGKLKEKLHLDMNVTSRVVSRATRRKLSKASKAMWRRPNYHPNRFTKGPCKKCGRAMGNAATSPLCVECRQVCPKCGGKMKTEGRMCRTCSRTFPSAKFRSSLETIVDNLLRRITSYKFQRPLWICGHPYDFGNKQLKIVIDVDGCWVHSHNCGSRKSGWNMMSAKRRKEVAIEHGYLPIILRECKKGVRGKRWRRRLIREITARNNEMETESRDGPRRRRD